MELTDVGVGVAVALTLSVLSLAVSFVEVFKDELGQRIDGEYLRLQYDDDPALCQVTQHDAFVDGYEDCIVVRLRVHNTGRRPGEDVRIMLTGADTRPTNTDDEWATDEGFCPIHLTWIHVDPGHILPQIPPGSSYLANLGILLPSGVTPTEANNIYEPFRFPSETSTFQLFLQRNPMNNSAFLTPNRDYRFRFEILTERGVRGKGTIYLNFADTVGFDGDPRSSVTVEVERDTNVDGRRPFQRDL